MIADIYFSFRRLPVWVQFWIALILVPVNIAPLAFWTAPNGPVIASLAIAGLAPNLVILLVARGFTKLMALSHLIFWSPLVALLAYGLATGAITGPFAGLAAVLLIVDVISIGFDLVDFRAWLQGDRARA